MNPELGLSQPAIYQIRVQGCLHDRWTEWFEGMALERDANRHTTTLTGVVPDQAALHGLLARIRDLGLTLLSVTCVAGTDGAETGKSSNMEKEGNLL